MTIETLHADGVVANNSGSGLGNAQGAPDGTWSLNTGSTPWDATWSMANPSEPLTPGVGLQSTSVRVRKDASGGGTPTMIVDVLRDGGTTVATTGSVSVTSATGEDIATPAWNGSVVTDPTTIQVRITVSPSGGSPANRRNIQVDAITWAADVTAAGPQQFAVSGTAAIASTTAGTVAARRPSSGTSAAVTATTGAPAARLPASGSSAVVSAVSGDAGLSSGQQFPVSGTAATVSTTSGTVAARLPASGSSAVVSASSGTVAAQLPTQGTATATSTTSGAPAARMTASGTAQAVSSISGGVAARQPTSATTQIVSATSGDAELAAAGAFDCVGTVPIATTVSGAPTARLVTSGTNPVISTITATLAALLAASSTTPVVSGTTGVLAARLASIGTVPIATTTIGNAVIVGERSPTPPGRTVITPPEDRVETPVEPRTETTPAQIREVTA